MLQKIPNERRFIACKSAIIKSLLLNIKLSVTYLLFLYKTKYFYLKKHLTYNFALNH